MLRVRRLLQVPDDLDDRHIRLLFAVALALLFEEYDLAMLNSALKYIAEELGIAERGLPNYLAWIRLGAIPAFVLIPFADRLGRKQVFLVSVVAMGALTFLTAFARTSTQFVLMQMMTRTFFVAGSAVAFVFISEEFPAHRRGYGIGMLGALAATGNGLGAALFAAIDKIPWGWRALYAVGCVPILLFPYFARTIPETSRFTAHAASHGGRRFEIFGWVEPLKLLWSKSRIRALGIALSGLLPAFGIVCTFQFAGYFVLKVHQWRPADYSMMVIFGGGVGIIGNVVAGRLGDRIGRRLVGAALLVTYPAFVSAFYLGPPWLLPLAWTAFVFASQGGRVILRALATELFPTAYRGAASGLFSILEVTGAAAGLFVLGRSLTDGDGNLAAQIPLIACATILGGLIVFMFPETKQKELESIA